MSFSITGHGDHGHGPKKKSPLIRFLVWLFLIIWIANAFVYYFTKPHGHGYGDTHAPPAIVSYFADPLYRSLQLFHFHDNHWDGHDQIIAYIARFVAAAFALGLPLILILWVVKGGFLRLLHGFTGKNFAVIVGENDHAQRLVRDLIANGRSVVFVTAEEKHDHHPAGALEISGDLSSPDFWLRSVRVRSAAEVILLSEDDATNIRWSVTIEKALGETPRPAPLVCHLHLADLHLKKGLMSLLPALGETTALERRYFSRHEIAARLLARRYPLPTTLIDEAAHPEHYVIVGFGQLGENVALKLVKMGQQILRRDTPDGPRYEVRSPRVTVIDKLGSKAADSFLRSHPGFTKTCDFNIHQLDCRDSRFLNLSFLEGLDPGERCSLIFCLEDETLVVSTILMMLDVCQSPEKDVDGIYLRSLRRDGPGDLLHRRQSSLSKSIPIVTFAADREIWNGDVVLGLSLDLMAERIHETYRRGVAKLPPEPGNPAPAANKTWLALTPEERDGNREPADHLWAKLRTLGYELEDAPVAGKALPSDLSARIEAHIEELASSEHYRWMAWRLINGWTYGTPRDNDARKHPDIVGYHELTEPGREKDRMIVRIIPDLISQGRLSISKVAPDGAG